MRRLIITVLINITIKIINYIEYTLLIKPIWVNNEDLVLWLSAPQLMPLRRAVQLCSFCLVKGVQSQVTLRMGPTQLNPGFLTTSNSNLSRDQEKKIKQYSYLLTTLLKHTFSMSTAICNNLCLLFKIILNFHMKMKRNRHQVINTLHI